MGRTTDSEIPGGVEKKGLTMWKIFIEYTDKSKLTLTGKHRDIPLQLAVKYYNQYAADRVCKAVYQRYPKKDFEAIGLFEKIEQLRMEGLK